MKEGTGLIGYDGIELREGDPVEFTEGPYKGTRAEVVWNPKGMWSLKYPDGINPYWISNPERLRIIPTA